MSFYFNLLLQLIDFLSNFHNDRSEDEQFNDEKAYLIKQASISKYNKLWNKYYPLRYFQINKNSTYFFVDTRVKACNHVHTNGS